MKVYIVETVSTFRHRYAVNAVNAEAAEEFVEKGIENLLELVELSQLYIEECISSTQEVNETEYLRVFEEDNDYLKDITLERKLGFINES
jgi:CRISPR/Cas system-associated protein Cas10 (large subunit of type III CRISPR-Cas system)